MKKDLRASRSRKIATFVAAVVTAILAACSSAAAPTVDLADRSLDPAVDQAVAKATALAAALPESYVAQGLLRERPLSRSITVTKLISDDEGGTIQISEADFRLEIPKGALGVASMTISVTALPGAAVAYNFEPHGVQFVAPLKFVQRLTHTNLHSVKLPADFQADVSGAYFSDASLIDPATGIAVVSESTPAEVTGSLNDGKLAFPVWHFSGYMASTGRGR
jgi:hypothetical protein